MKGVDLRGKSEQSFFAVDNDIFVGQRPPFIGTIRSVMGESVVPVVVRTKNDPTVRCIGSGFFISCSALLITAAHVITDPIERKYGTVLETGNRLESPDFQFGVLVPTNPFFQQKGFIFFPIEWSLFLADRTASPIPIAGLDLKITSDIAICKVPPRPGDHPHQPLTIIQSGFQGTGIGVGSDAYALGYAGMQDFSTETSGNTTIFHSAKFELHGSIGKIIERFPLNFEKQEVPTPGPCFSFAAKISGGMSGGPIFDREGVYVHGVISKGWEFAEDGAEHLSYGSMLGPSLGLPISLLNSASLAELQKGKEHGFPVIGGAPGL
jgi:hypothetical protein